MKKVLLIAGLVTLTATAFGQKATTDAPFSLEGLVNYNTSSLSFTSPAVRARYFLSDNLALRLQVGIDNSTTKRTAYELPTGGQEGTYTYKSSMMNFGLGAEYHFKGTDRLSPYAGAQFNFGTGKDKLTTENYDSSTDAFTPNYTEEGSQGTLHIGGQIVGGVDIYLVQNLYMGVELGFVFGTTSLKEGEYTVTNAGVGATSKLAPGKDGSFVTSATAAFRFGWRF